MHPKDCDKFWNAMGNTYYVYSPLTNIVERVGTQGAAYGGTNALRTVTTYYPVGGEQGTGNGAGSSVPLDRRAGFVAAIRHEDGKLDLYDYELISNCWVRTVTHLHEQAPVPVSGKTTRDVTVTNARGEVLEERTEAFIDGAWHVIARERYTYNFEGKIVQRENLAGQITITAWDCCHKVSEAQPDGSMTTWDYDGDGRMIASSRLIPLDMTNVTWLTTCYEYDDLGRQTATWQTNYAAQVGLPVGRTRYDALGRVIARVDQLGNTTSTTYSPDGRTLSVHNPNTSTRVIFRSAYGDTLSVTGTAVTPEFHSYGVLPDGSRWHKTVQGETASSPRFAKSYKNLLGQTIREERSGFQGAVLATTHAYDSFGRPFSTSSDYEPVVEFTYDILGNRIATTRIVGRAVSMKPPEWRKTESFSSFVLDDSIVWLTQTNIVSCSDASIAPLVSSSSRQLTSLTAARPACSRSYDVRGNVTENELLVSSPFVTSRQTVPYATNRPLAVSRYGVELQTVSVSAVTNTIAYDSLGRQVANTDGRGNTRHTEYNALGQRSASIDALGNRTTYAYDQFGNLAAVTNALGNATVYEYDLRERKTYEGGATYPVRYTYDVFGNKTTMMTYRNESLGPNSGDVTTWLYDVAYGSMTNKVYADGKGPTYSYTPDGKLSRRTWARGIVTDYSYDGWNNLTNTVYSDGTPTVSLFYDAFGRQTEARDAAGVTTFLYDSFGSLTNETVIGVSGANTIGRYWDSCGRTAGYALNGTRQTTICYDLATGRIASMLANGRDVPFIWSYLSGTDLKSSLAYPNGLSTFWQYDAAGQMLQVCNSTPTNVISKYEYAYDAAGRRISCSHSGSAFDHADHIDYGYNNRSELTNASATIDTAYSYSYRFDDIGNRESAFERGTNIVYAANRLNQYVAVDDFSPQFDDDGNGMRVETSTGIWSVTYNGENRPILWAQGTNTISMSYDRFGRRVAKSNQRFVYDGYLQIANFDSAATNSQLTIHNSQLFIWDATEPVATRPLVWTISTTQPFNISTSFYAHDGNKNASEIIAEDEDVAAHYEYAPFGAVTIQNGMSAAANPWRFSSEYAENDTLMWYYNYRHYDSNAGRWITRDIVESVVCAYVVCMNDCVERIDYLGLYGNPVVSPEGVPLGPASPYDPNVWLWQNEDNLAYDRLWLENKLRDLCPRDTKEMVVSCKCCSPVDCNLQAARLADAAYSKVNEMRGRVLCGYWPGNILSVVGMGYKCSQWQEALYKVLQDEIKKSKRPCFKIFGVGNIYKNSNIAYHVWVRIISCKTRFFSEHAITKGPGVSIDPWESGGESLFGAYDFADKIVKMEEGFSWCE